MKYIEKEIEKLIKKEKGKLIHTSPSKHNPVMKRIEQLKKLKELAKDINV